MFLVVANPIEGVHSRGGAYTFTVSGSRTFSLTVSALGQAAEAAVLSSPAMLRDGWRHRRLARPGVLAAFVLVPSLGIVQKYLRTRGAVVYAAVGFLALLVAHRRSNTLRGLAAVLSIGSGRGVW